jgi:hypothetical protein
MSFMEDGPSQGPLPHEGPPPEPAPPPATVADPFETPREVFTNVGKAAFFMVINSPLPVVFGAALGASLGSWGCLIAASLWLVRAAMEDLYDYD